MLLLPLVGGLVSNPPLQSILSISPTSISAPPGLAGTVITTFTATMSNSNSPPFAGTWSISGGNAALFSTNSTTGACAYSTSVGTGNYNFLVTARPSNSLISPLTSTVNITVANTLLLINGSTLPATIPAGDEFWIGVRNGAGSAHDQVRLLDSSNGIWNTYPADYDLPAGNTDDVMTLTNGGRAAVPPGSYSLVLLSPYPSVAANLPITVTNAIQEPFPWMSAANDMLTYYPYATTGRIAGANYWGSGQVVSGTIVTFGPSIWAGNGQAGPTDITIQWILSGSISGVITDLLFSASGTQGGGPSHFTGSPAQPTLTLNTTLLQDGSYILHAKVIDTADSSGNNWAPLQLEIFPIPVIIMNNPSASVHNPALPHTIPSANYYGNNRSNTPNTQIDYLNYQGLPQLNNAAPFPDTTIIPPSNSVNLRNPANWYVATVGDGWPTEYFPAGMFWTSNRTPQGGIFKADWITKNGAGVTVEDSYPYMKTTSFLDGGRNQNMLAGVTLLAATPSGSPFSAPWTGVDMSGRLFTYTNQGTLTTIAGYKRDGTKLPMFWSDSSNPEVPNTILVGTIDTNPLYTFGDMSGPHDLHWDPRDPEICYLARPLDHFIVKINFHTQTLNSVSYGLSNPLLQRYAGYDGGLNNDGSWGYADGPALSTGSNGAQFGGPYSICIQSVAGISGHPIGTMYVADNYNGLIRQISPGTLDINGNLTAACTVTTLVGLHGGSSPPCADASGHLGAFFNNTLSATDTYNVTSLTQSGVNGIVILTTPSKVAGVGWKVTVQVNGNNYRDNNFSSLETSTYAVYTVVTFTDSQHFTININPIPTSGPITLVVYNSDIYSSPSQVTFANAYAAYPGFLRMSSAGDIIVGESWYNHMLRRIWLSGPNVGTLTRIGPFGNVALPVGLTWGTHDVDTIGTCGPLDDIVFFKTDSAPGSAESIWRASIDGSYSSNFIGDMQKAFPIQGTGGGGHYPWAIAFSRTEARIISLGLNGVLFSWHARQGTEPNNTIDAYMARYLLAGDGYSEAYLPRDPWLKGTHSQLPYGLRPSFAALWAENACHWFGANVLPTIDDLWSLYPNDFAPFSGSLAQYIQNGLGGIVTRPEFAIDDEAAPTNAPYSAPVPGRLLAQIIYFLRRQSLQGSGFGGPNTLYQRPPMSLDFVRPNITVQSGDPTRISSTSIRVRWTTNKNTIGVIVAGTTNSHGKVWPYNLWTSLETSYTTSHDQTLTGIPAAPTPTYIVVVTIDKAGNWNRSQEFAVS